MELIYVCSPYKGDVEYNVAKTRRYCRFAFTQGVVPFAPHLHNTQFLDDTVLDERNKGMILGLHMLNRSDELWAFGDKNTEGMIAEIQAAERLGIPIKYFNDRCERRGE